MTEPVDALPADERAFARQIYAIVRDLIQPRPAIYWLDLLVTSVIGWTALTAFLLASDLSILQIVSGTIAGLALYRALMFIHELAHLTHKRFRWFHVAYNVLAGVPLMTPSFLYAEHRTHHVNHSYGTHGDSEYYPIGRGPVGLVVWFVLQGLLFPILGVVRFAVLTPVSLLHPSLRTLVWQRASGLTQNNPHFRRPWPTAKEFWPFAIQEAGSFLVAWTVLGLVMAGIIPVMVLVRLYLLFACVTTLSYARALANHLYVNEGEPMSYIAQMLDSTTIPGRPIITELWAPLGQRYHALHHLVPSLPYHALGTAHRRLMAQLPDDSPYRETIRSGFFSAISGVFRLAHHGGTKNEPIAIVHQVPRPHGEDVGQRQERGERTLS